jgi:hypothetical protein
MELHDFVVGEDVLDTSRSVPRYRQRHPRRGRREARTAPGFEADTVYGELRITGRIDADTAG